MLTRAGAVMKQKINAGKMIDALDNGRVLTWYEPITGQKIQSKWCDILLKEMELNYRFNTDGFVSFKEWLTILGIDIPIRDSDMINLVGWSTWQMMDAYSECWVPIGYAVRDDGSFSFTYPVEPNEDYLEY